MAVKRPKKLRIGVKPKYTKRQKREMVRMHLWEGKNPEFAADWKQANTIPNPVKREYWKDGYKRGLHDAGMQLYIFRVWNRSAKMTFTVGCYGHYKREAENKVRDYISSDPVLRRMGFGNVDLQDVTGMEDEAPDNYVKLFR